MLAVHKSTSDILTTFLNLMQASVARLAGIQYQKKARGKYRLCDAHVKNITVMSAAHAKGYNKKCFKSAANSFSASFQYKTTNSSK